MCTQIYRWLFPSYCVLCGQPTYPQFNICNPCHTELPILPHHCQQCAQLLPSYEAERCGSCLKTTPPFDRIYALFAYDEPIAQWIVQLKFKGQLQYAQCFAELFLERIQPIWYRNKALPQIIIPIPLHRDRLRERGFNQAVEIAKPLAKRLKIHLDLNSIVRHKATLPQSGLRALERENNVANAFVCNRDFSHLSIAVLDDVITTGHTIRAFCSLLKKKGAKNIDVWCCARRS